MKTFVLDASVAIEWFENAGRPSVLVDPAILDDHVVAVPHVWHTEILNWIAMANRSGKMTDAEAMRAAIEMLSWPTITGHDNDSVNILSLCRRHRLTAYDASYLSLAMESGWRLATLDKALIKAANAVGVELVS